MDGSFTNKCSRARRILSRLHTGGRPIPEGLWGHPRDVRGVPSNVGKRFPFAVYYLIEEETIDVYAILDCRRDPEWIVKRLDSSRTMP